MPSNITIENNTFQQSFTHLEKDRIPTGLLADASIDFADLKKYDGTIPDSSYTSSKVVLDIYSTLVTSRLNAQTNFTKTSTNFATDWNNAQYPDVVPLGGVFYRYAKKLKF